MPLKELFGRVKARLNEGRIIESDSAAGYMVIDEHMSNQFFVAPRQVRIFISSTFYDMQVDRDVLVKHVFPELKKRCLGHDIDCLEVDLRWGVRKEEDAPLQVCLDEIDRCRPYFVCLLGERYGWIPLPEVIPADEFILLKQHIADVKNQAILDRWYQYRNSAVSPVYVLRAWRENGIDYEHWQAEEKSLRSVLQAALVKLDSLSPEQRDKYETSITDLECRYGVLDADPDQMRAFFYLRDPAYCQTIASDVKDGFVDDDPNSRRKLADLKTRVRAYALTHKQPLWDGYPNPEELKERVLNDLWTAIQADYPFDAKLDDRQRENRAHEAFAASRSKLYVGRRRVIDQLDNWAKRPNLPLVVTGAAGVGKSALLANWAGYYRARHPEHLVFLHFTGAMLRSMNYRFLILRLLTELKATLNLSQELPAIEDVVTALPEWLTLAAKQVPAIVLVLDGLDQLEDETTTKELFWLPPQFPPNVHVLLSIREVNATVEERKWPVLPVEPLNNEERSYVVQKMLTPYGKQLTSAQLEIIVGKELTANPLFLRQLLEELRVFGDDKQLTEHIQYYLAASNIQNLYERILARLEKDYSYQGRNVTAEVLSLILASHTGLSEKELRALLGDLPLTALSPILLALKESLVNRDGLLGFAHVEVAEAARRYLLSKSITLAPFRERLVDYFSTSARNTRRELDELPYQYIELGQWPELYNFLCTPHIFNLMWEKQPWEMLALWRRLATESNYSLLTFYQQLKKEQKSRPQMMSRPPVYKDLFWNLANAMIQAGFASDAQGLWSDMSNHYLGQRDYGNAAICIQTLANIQMGQGKMDRALATFKRADTFIGYIRLPVEQAKIYESQGLVEYYLGNLVAAKSLSEKAVALLQGSESRRTLAAALSNLSMILSGLGQIQQATKAQKEAEEIFHELGDHPGVIQLYLTRANTLQVNGRYPQALELAQKVEKMARERGFNNLVADARLMQAGIHNFQGTPQLHLLKESEEYYQSSGSQYQLARTYLLRGSGLAHNTKTIGESLPYIEKAWKMFDALGHRMGVSEAMQAQAFVLLKLERHTDALQTFQELEPILREGNQSTRLAQCLSGQAYCFWIIGNESNAQEKLKEAEQIFRQQNNMVGYGMILVNQAKNFLDRNNDQRAKKVLTQALQIFEEQGADNYAQMAKEVLQKLR